ncbi:EAL domain-containing protein [Sulfurihydrogenibium sp.]|jgi:diguanylate cyclase (GGDEF)-like protein|uniref:EAL domain-containing protein n=1 Tax=Sulfurihydrogenibium sp. TaxID=2053621 RepID=UPI00260537CC|nr:EAL domain-containing protein [Sulfurihydrogenibium sp.]
MFIWYNNAMGILDIFKKNKEGIEPKYIDKITGVYNRNYISEIEKNFHKLSFAVILLDLDNFSNIHKVFGKDIADLLLQDVVKIVKNNIRKEDIIIRIGDDEFLILVKKFDNNTKPLDIAQRIINKISLNKFNLINNTVKITAFAGIYLHPEKETDFSLALKKANTALLKAKQKRNTVEIYSDGLEYRTDKILTDIKMAIEEKRLICYFQPIFDLETMKAIKFEALVRIISPERKIIVPNLFLASIKNTYIYKELTKKIIEFNLSIVRTKKIKVSINLLSSDILDIEIINFLTSLNKDFTTMITLEISETESIDDYGMLRENLQILKKAGYEIALDDFGSGFFSILQLIEFQLDYIKIDGQIIRKIDTDPISYAAAKAIKSLTKEINIKTIAEFVSNKEIYDKLKEIGIDYGQGFYFKEPLHPSEIR